MKRWPQVRAGLIALVLAVGLVDGCPLPVPPYDSELQREVVEAVRPVQHVVLTPFRWISRVFHVTQRWALFQVARRETFRLEVAGRRGDTWELLFRAGDGDHDTYRGLLLDARVRGAWYPADRAAHQFGPFSDWFLAKVLADHPEYAAARLQFERVVLEPAEGTVRGTGAFVMRMEKVR
ncbi:MAG: hypothetical protein JNL83_02725 [Myxococcales bacterium]|nr:hypothetical protein [Myxococcales bacterium]